MPQLSRKSQTSTAKFKSPMVTLQNQRQVEEYSENITTPTTARNKQLSENNEELNSSEELNKSIEKLFKELSYNENSAKNSENRISQEVLNSEPMKTKYLQFWNITPTKELTELSQRLNFGKSKTPTGKENSVTSKSQSQPLNNHKINKPASVDQNTDLNKSMPSELIFENDNPMNSTSVETNGKSTSLKTNNRRNTIHLTVSFEELLESCKKSAKQAYLNVGSSTETNSQNLDIDDTVQQKSSNEDSRETPTTEQEILQRSGKKTAAKKEQKKIPKTPVNKKQSSKIIDKTRTPEKAATKKLQKGTKTTEISKKVKGDKSSTKTLVIKKNTDNRKNLPNVDKLRLIHESRNVGLYVLCDSCNKARYLSEVKDPLELPKHWYCKMNSDKTHNKCSDPEEVEEDEEFLIDNLYNSGSIVWAKLGGYPWWPAMVEDDPDIEQYFWLEENIVAPTFYHVSFFDSERVTRAWIETSKLKPFKSNDKPDLIRNREFSEFYKRLKIATRQAVDALELSLINRLKKYSFIYRYKVTSKKKTGKTNKNQKTNRREKVGSNQSPSY